MLIDWFTVGFQIINFLILIALLKRFLYGPILCAMDKREETIATGLFEAAKAKDEAETRALVLAKEQEAFASSKNQMEAEARQEIDKWRQESLDRIKEEIADMRTSWQQNLVQEQETFLRNLKIHISRQVFQVGQKAMADLADTRLETRLVETFLGKINQEPGISVEEEVEKSTALLVTTGFPMKGHLKEALKIELKRCFPWSGRIDFNQDKTLGFGICLVAGNLKWEWNLSCYMHDMEKDIIKNMGMAVGKRE